MAEAAPLATVIRLKDHRKRVVILDGKRTLLPRPKEA